MTTEKVLVETQDPPAPQWPVPEPQIQPTLRHPGPPMGSVCTSKGGK